MIPYVLTGLIIDIILKKDFLLRIFEGSKFSVPFLWLYVEERYCQGSTFCGFEGYCGGFGHGAV